MSNEQHLAPRRFAQLGAGLLLSLTLCGCGDMGLLPHQTEMSGTPFKSYEDVEAAYGNIQPGKTRDSELSSLGFDVAVAPNVEVLSYLGVTERFMPRGSIGYDSLPLAVRSCIDAQDRCSAYVFKPTQLEYQRTGNFIPDALGFDRTTVNRGWSAEVVLLMRDGVVVYKLMSGEPRIENVHTSTQPLGPLEDPSNMVNPPQHGH